MTYLPNINSPADLKKLPAEALQDVCNEVREYIIQCCAHNPGHFGASLGTVELIVAMHYVFDCPRDKFVFDVGHQAYTHKIITGRQEAFVDNRKYGCISGFPRREESPFDAFGTGHSSTSISAALGMAVAAQLQGRDEQVIAVIGDGAMTGGMAYEGLNNAGARNTNMLVILNDNQMSIDPNVGGLHNYLLKITTSERYNRIKQKTWKALGPSLLRNFIQKLVKSFKRFLLGQSTLFQALGFRYFGPIDGHNVLELVKTLERLKKIKGPRLLHVLTEKGHGYQPAILDQSTWHAPGTFDVETGLRTAETGKTKLRFQDVFGRTVLDLARCNTSIVGITPAMPSGSSLNMMMHAFPERCFDVGIAEQHAVTFAAGLAAEGMLPYCVIYSSFMQRAYDSVIHDVALQKLKVVMCLDRGGLVGEDGATHHGSFDLSAFRCIPNLIIAAPEDESQLRDMLFSAQSPQYGPVIIRYPRGGGRGSIDWEKPFSFITPGEGRCLRSGGRIAVLSIGTAGLKAEEAIVGLEKEGIQIAHYDFRFLKPLDAKLLETICRQYDCIVSIEDGSLIGGFHSAIADFLADGNYPCHLRSLGLPDRFIQHGSLPLLYKECGIDAASIREVLLEEFRKL